MEEFRQFSGFGDALNALPSNPLPAVLVVHPKADQSRPGAVEGLVQRLRVLPQVDLANLDMQWVERLYAVMDIAKRGVLILAGLFGIGVLLIVGNTIRMAIQNRREEIEVEKAHWRNKCFYTQAVSLLWLLVRVIGRRCRLCIGEREPVAASGADTAPVPPLWRCHTPGGA